MGQPTYLKEKIRALQFIFVKMIETRTCCNLAFTGKDEFAKKTPIEGNNTPTSSLVYIFVPPYIPALAQTTTPTVSPPDLYIDVNL